MDSDSSPFVKTFKTSTQHYIYDVNSNALFQADEATCTVAEIWRKAIGRDELVGQLKHRFSARTIYKAIKDIQYWMDRGYLSSFRPKGLRFPLSHRQIRKELSSHVCQLILEITENCNLRCKYCVYGGTYQHFRMHRSADMSSSLALKALEFFYDHSGDEEKTSISFYGGEPLYNFSLIKRCVEFYEKKADHRNVSYNINTNGTLLKDEVVDFLVKHNILLRVSLDGPQDIHDANRCYRNGHGSFNTIIIKLDRIRKRYPEYYNHQVSICAVDGWPYNIFKRIKFFDRNDLFKGMSISVNGVRKFDTSYFKKFPYALSNDTGCYDPQDYIDQVLKGQVVSSALRGLFERTMTEIVKRYIDQPLKQYEYPNKICLLGSRRLFVDTKGRFQPCERFNNTIFIGDIENGFDYKEIYRLIDDYIRIS